MVERASPVVSDPVAVTGSGCCVLAAGEADTLDVSRLLKSRKMRKFMGKQDQLAVAAAGGALEARGLRPEELRGRTGIYLTVGYIPFERADIEAMARHSVDGAAFSMQRFSTDGIDQVNPLLTFRCLPNMPAFHVSLNFNVQGPYHVAYPGAGQFYTALEEAFAALAAGAIDVALVGAVADQTNGLVEHHFARLTPPLPAADLGNAAAFLVVEDERGAAERGAPIAARLVDYRLAYAPAEPFDGREPRECLARDGLCAGTRPCLGPVSLPAALAATRGARVTHNLRSRDGFDAASVWDVA